MSSSNPAQAYPRAVSYEDLTKALKASPPVLSLRIDSATLNIEPTPAPPPSPVDYDFSPTSPLARGGHSSSSASVADDWKRSGNDVSVEA